MAHLSVKAVTAWPFSIALYGHKYLRSVESRAILFITTCGHHKHTLKVDVPFAFDDSNHHKKLWSVSSNAYLRQMQ